MHPAGSSKAIDSVEEPEETLPKKGEPMPSATYWRDGGLARLSVAS
ncbi:MAG: hypothetical protein NVSMB14_05640 [Isosphaeraceae bacterium]